MLKLPFFTDLLSSQLFYIVENRYSGKNVGLGMKKKWIQIQSLTLQAV